MIRSKSRSYPSKGSRRETVSLPGTIWRYFGWLVPGLFVLALLSFGWWEVSKGRILALFAAAEATTGSSIPARVGIAPLASSDGKVAVSDLVAEESGQEAPTEPDTLIDDQKVEAQVLDRLVGNETEAQVWDGRLAVATSSPDDKPLHVVRPGETLYAIARQHDVGVDSLLALNPLRNPDLLWVRLPPTKTQQDDRHHQIFLPVYTTQKEGKGTGLGMYVVEQVVEQHSGYFQLESEVGVGTTVTVGIPTAKGHIRSEL